MSSDFRSSHWKCSVKKVNRKTPVQCLFTLLKKETLAQVFSSEFHEIFKNKLFYKPPPDNEFALIQLLYERMSVWYEFTLSSLTHFSQVLHFIFSL